VGDLVLSDLRHPDDGSVVAVDRLVLAEGERTVLFGPNGSGKTTLLRLVAGTLGDGTGLPVTYLPQRPYLFRGTARSNLHLGLDPSERRRADELAERLGMAGVVDQMVEGLSGGERQRIALARALAKGSALVVLDEPLAPLDLRDRSSTALGIADAIGERTALIVSHDRETVAVLGDRVAVMIDGAIVQSGRVGDVFAHPRDDVVAGVVGVGNVLSGVVEARRGPMVRVRCGPVLFRAVGDHEPGTQVTVLFGAETVSIHLPVDRTEAAASRVHASPRNSLSGTVADIREVGRLHEIVVDCGIPVVALITPGALDALDLRIGMPVAVTVKATAARAVLAT